jgi:hypothetical protein
MRALLAEQIPCLETSLPGSGGGPVEPCMLVVVVHDGEEVLRRRVALEQVFVAEAAIPFAVVDLLDDLRAALATPGIARQPLTAYEGCDWFAGYHDDGINDWVMEACTWFFTGISHTRDECDDIYDS